MNSYIGENMISILVYACVMEITTAYSEDYIQLCYVIADVNGHLNKNSINIFIMVD
jgi:hypothetical protein